MFPFFVLLVSTLLLSVIGLAGMSPFDSWTWCLRCGASAGAELRGCPACVKEWVARKRAAGRLDLADPKTGGGCDDGV